MLLKITSNLIFWTAARAGPGFTALREALWIPAKKVPSLDKETSSDWSLIIKKNKDMNVIKKNKPNHKNNVEYNDPL